MTWTFQKIVSFLKFQKDFLITLPPPPWTSSHFFLNTVIRKRVLAQEKKIRAVLWKGFKTYPTMNGGGLGPRYPGSGIGGIRIICGGGIGPDGRKGIPLKSRIGAKCPGIGWGPRWGEGGYGKRVIPGGGEKYCCLIPCCCCCCGLNWPCWGCGIRPGIGTKTGRGGCWWLPLRTLWLGSTITAWWGDAGGGGPFWRGAPWAVGDLI